MLFLALYLTSGYKMACFGKEKVLYQYSLILLFDLLSDITSPALPDLGKLDSSSSNIKVLQCTPQTIDMKICQ